MDMQLNHYISCGAAFLLAVLTLFFVEYMNCINIKDKESVDFLESETAVCFYGKVLFIGFIVLAVATIAVMLFIPHFNLK